MAFPGLAQEDHTYLGKDYCSGYTDVYGKWATGFYCPQYGSKTAVFCCGTAVFKYCCTNQEPFDPSTGGGGGLLDGDDPNFDGDSNHGVSSAVFVRVPIVFGVVCGIAAVLVLLIVAACYFCSCCFGYKKRRSDHHHQHHNNLTHHLNHLHLNHPILPSHPPPSLSQTGLYRNSGSSTTPSASSTITAASSNLLNFYSGGTSGGGPLTTSSLVTTPLDLDWASGMASTYQSQQQLFPPPLAHPSLQFAPNTLTPAAATTLAVALSQQHQQRATPSACSLLQGGTGTPSIISGTTLCTATGRLPALPSGYHPNFLNSSTLSSNSQSAAPLPAPRGISHHPQQPQLHRGNLPQQISTTASIVNSYLSSLQQSHQIQNHSVEPPPTIERTRHPSPPPSYFQTVSSSSYHPNGHAANNNYINNNNRNPRSQNGQRQNSSRMAAIQSILGGGNSYSGGGGGTIWNNEDDLLLAEFLLRHENTLRRSLGLSNNSGSNNRNHINNNINNNSSNNTSNATPNSARNRNPMLTQRELIELLLRLTYHPSTNMSTGGNGGVPVHSSSSSVGSRSDSQAGSDCHSTSSSVATTRSTSSNQSSASHNVIKVAHNNNNATSCTKLIISEVDEDEGVIGTPGSGGGGGSIGGGRDGISIKTPKTACLDLSLSRLSAGENSDSGVASSTSSTMESEVVDHEIGSINMISTALSRDAIKLKKQPHAVDDDGGGSVPQHHHHHHLTISDKLLNEQQLETTIHAEGSGAISEEDKCTKNAGGSLLSSTNGGMVGGNDEFKGIQNKCGAVVGFGGGSDGEILEKVGITRVGDRDHLDVRNLNKGDSN